MVYDLASIFFYLIFNKQSTTVCFYSAVFVRISYDDILK